MLWMLVGVLLLCQHFAYAQSLSGIRIGDPVSVIKKIGLAPVARNQTGPFTMLRWVFQDGNELSVTSSTSSGRIVYVESDWGGNRQGSFTDYPGFLFGQTKLSDIRQRFGSNGMAFSGRAAIMNVADGIVTSNAYEAGNIIVTFITKVGSSSMQNFLINKDLGHTAKLDAISLADPDYASTAWGDMIKDSRYHPITWR